MQYKRIVLNEPHASIEGLYDNQLSFWNIDEHFINDIVLKCDPLEQQGQGIVYKQFDGYTRTVPEENEVQLLSLWHWHQQRLRDNLCEGALLLDCHSFPSEMSDVDICIGFNEDWSKPHKATVELAVNLFEDNGYKVGINEPYSNSETPACPFSYQSMMLEVNKKAYMEDGSLRLIGKNNHKRDVRDIINNILSELET